LTHYRKFFETTDLEHTTCPAQRKAFFGDFLWAKQPVWLSMNWLQIRLFGPEFISFSTNSYGYYSQMS
jgi:hypothetical protein